MELLKILFRFFFDYAFKPFAYIMVWYISIGLILISMYDFYQGFELFGFVFYAVMLGFNAYLQLLILSIMFYFLLEVLLKRLKKTKEDTNN